MRHLIAVVAMISLPWPAIASQWFVEKNEQDPFDKTKSTFVAITNEGGHMLAARCLENELSFLINVQSGSAEKDEKVAIQLVADAKPQILDDGYVLDVNVLTTGIQFGDESTFTYLERVHKFWIRLTTSTITATYAFTGGRSFDDAIIRAKRACGVEALPAPQTPSPTSSRLAKPLPTPSPTKTIDCSTETSCSRQFRCLDTQHQLGDSPDEDSFMRWCLAPAALTPSPGD